MKGLVTRYVLVHISTEVIMVIHFLWMVISAIWFTTNLLVGDYLQAIAWGLVGLYSLGNLIMCDKGV